MHAADLLGGAAAACADDRRLVCAGDGGFDSATSPKRSARSEASGSASISSDWRRASLCNRTREAGGETTSSRQVTEARAPRRSTEPSDARRSFRALGGHGIIEDPRPGAGRRESVITERPAGGAPSGVCGPVLERAARAAGVPPPPPARPSADSARDSSSPFAEAAEAVGLRCWCCLMLPATAPDRSTSGIAPGPAACLADAPPVLWAKLRPFCVMSTMPSRTGLCRALAEARSGLLLHCAAAAAAAVVAAASLRRFSGDTTPFSSSAPAPRMRALLAAARWRSIMPPI